MNCFAIQVLFQEVNWLIWLESRRSETSPCVLDPTGGAKGSEKSEPFFMQAKQKILTRHENTHSDEYDIARMQRYPLFCCYSKIHCMKHLSGKLYFLAILLYLTACTKTAGPSNVNGTAGLTGKWNLVIDSTFEGVGTSNHLVDYTGEAGDYFNFSTNGYVYTKEGTVLDTLTYRVVSDTGIIISDFGLFANNMPDTCTISGLTANNGLGLTVQVIVIESPFFPTQGGVFWRKVTLRR